MNAGWLAPLLPYLPSINAGFNSLSACLLLLGYVAVRRRRLQLHRRAMLAAFTSSSLFLIGYLTRVALSGTHRFPGTGALLYGYWVLLGSHMVLAVVLVPLVLRALFLALNGRFAEHRRVTRWTWPIWMYVSVTGVVVYLMLYHLGPSLVPPPV